MSVRSLVALRARTPHVCKILLWHGLPHSGISRTFIYGMHEASQKNQCEQYMSFQCAKLKRIPRLVCMNAWYMIYVSLIYDPCTCLTSCSNSSTAGCRLVLANSIHLTKHHVSQSRWPILLTGRLWLHATASDACVNCNTLQDRLSGMKWGEIVRNISSHECSFI